MSRHFQSKNQIVGELAKVELSGDNKDLKVVEIAYMGGSFTFYAEEGLYEAVKAMEVGTPVTVAFESIPDDKAAGNNKLKTLRGSARLVNKS